MAQIEQMLREQKTWFYMAQDGRGIAALAMAEYLPWESEILKVKCAAVREVLIGSTSVSQMETAAELLSVLEKSLRGRGVKLVVFKNDCFNVQITHALERSGFLLMDTLLEYVYSFSDPVFKTIYPPTIAKNLRLRPARADDHDKLVDLAERAFQGHFGRFHSDAAISHRQAVEIYRQWANAASKGYCDWIWLAEKDERIAGFSAWKMPSPLEKHFKLGLAHYSIGMIHPDFHGQGLFKALTYEGMRHLAKQGYLYVDGPTHINNYPVQRGYANLGWRIANARHAFHKWL